jgi:hypothetical protein
MAASRLPSAEMVTAVHTFEGAPVLTQDCAVAAPGTKPQIHNAAAPPKMFLVFIGQILAWFNQTCSERPLFTSLPRAVKSPPSDENVTS